MFPENICTITKFSGLYEKRKKSQAKSKPVTRGLKKKGLRQQKQIRDSDRHRLSCQRKERDTNLASNSMTVTISPQLNRNMAHKEKKKSETK